MDTVLLDVAIGVAVVFFVVASIVAGANEFVTRLLDTRAKAMWKAIEHAVDPAAGAPLTLGFRETLGWAFGHNDRRPGEGSVTNAGLLAASPIVAVLGGRTGIVKRRTGRTKVDQISSEIFARAVLHVGSLGENAAGFLELRSARQAVAAVAGMGVLTRDGLEQVSERWPLVKVIGDDPDGGRSALGERLGGLGTAGAELVEPLVNAAAALHAATSSPDSGVWRAAADAVAAVGPAVEGALSQLTQTDVAKVRATFEGTPLGTVVDQVVSQGTYTLAELAAAVSTWFDGYMARLSELYRLATRKILAVAGLVLAVVLNINAITLIGDLRDNADFRRALTDVAVGCAPAETTSTTSVSTSAESSDDDDDPKPVTSAELQECAKRAKEAYDDAAEAIRVPVLGKPQGLRESLGDGDRRLEASDIISGRSGASLLGWLTTGVAVSFGAPFWFDVMQGLVSLRKRVS